MIGGSFTDSAQRAEEAREVALARRADAALAELGHATCTLGVDVAYLGQLERGLDLLAEAAAIARRAGRLDDLMRAAANRTTLLDLDARREEALAVVEEGIAEAEAGGLAGTYGAFLRGNAADILYQLGPLDRVGGRVPRGHGVAAGGRRVVQPHALPGAGAGGVARRR